LKLGIPLAAGLTGLSAASAATLIYGALVEAERLVYERRVLPLDNWPERLEGYRVALLADLHLRDEYSLRLTQRAVAMALDESPDMVVLAGDFVGYWKDESAPLLYEALEPLLLMNGNAVAVPGNHDYWRGNPTALAPILSALNIRLLRNDIWTRDGICWAGVDSMNALMADPFTTMIKASAQDDPIIALWHEPDCADWLPRGASLMLSGHSHGGQFRFPWGWTPKHTLHGEKYVEGFYPEAPTPVYVSRGVGTTGPPSRLTVLPEVSILTLVAA
jgi:uncharacterized protein